MMVLNQEADKIYNMAFVQEVELRQHYWGVDQIPMALIVAHIAGETKTLGKYTDMEVAKEVLQELLEATAQGVETFRIPPIDC